ncbi:DUF6473 family protein [Rhodobaculum claviforme]|uniref:DUF6473 family protein n=1 Tax=Rhodobaculum claviforme TaxID=1549854 RepID=UPI001913F55E|nr:DUF6473 family protein [Rhodobaculum claviforme]
MEHPWTGPVGLDGTYCGYVGSRLRFRGPARSLDGPYVAALGGAATFGKGVARPWPHLLEGTTGHRVVNFGAVGAGPEALAHDLGVIAACRRAQAVVVQLSGAGQVTTPLYRVHPRRNDRFLEAGAELRAQWPEVDFSAFTFTGQMLDALHACDPGRFTAMAERLRTAWTARMAEVLDRLAGTGRPVLLLWLRERPAHGGAHPALITRSAVDPLIAHSAGLVVAPPPGGRLSPAALPETATHVAAAAALAPLVDQLGTTRPRAAG